MKVLVTGANGFLGKELVKKLVLHEGLEINALIREGSNIAEISCLGINIIRGDLTRQIEIRKALEDVDIVFHLAATLSGSHTDMILNTVVGTENLLNELERTDIKRFVLVSSFSVYGLANLRSRSVMDENAPIEQKLQLRDSYAIAKIRQERIVRKRCFELNIPLVVIRPGIIYGRDSDPIPIQLGIKIPGTCFLYIGGTNYMPFTHVSNCADAIILAGFKNGVEGNVFNIIDDSLPTQKEYLKIYKSEIGKIPKMIWIPGFMFRVMALGFEYLYKCTKGNIPPVITRYRMANYYKFFKFSNLHAKLKLDWQPVIQAKDGLREKLRKERREILEWVNIIKH